MIEPAMYLSIGFLLAGLLAIIFIPLVHNRAVRLTMRRLEASTPLSLAEIQADKDQLRAEFAMSARRLELSVEHLQSRTAGLLAELGEKTAATNRLKVELGEKQAALAALGSHDTSLQEQLRAAEDENALKAAALEQAESLLAEKTTALAELTSELEERTAVANSQRVELVSLRTQIDALGDRSADYEREIKATFERLERAQQEARQASASLQNETGLAKSLHLKIAELEQLVQTHGIENTTLGERAQDLETQLANSLPLLAQREEDCIRLRNAIEAAKRTEAELRASMISATERHSETLAASRAEKKQVEKELAGARDECARLLAELSAAKRDAEASWAADRVETSLLRERINDVAAQVAHLTAALDGPNSPIDAILSEELATSRKAHRSSSAPMPDSGSSLSERMRALQLRASRLVSPT